MFRSYQNSMFVLLLYVARPGTKVCGIISVADITVGLSMTSSHFHV
jgi:hypothetical protein